MVYGTTVHQAEEGGYWAEIAWLPGCFTQAEDLETLTDRLHEAVWAYLDEEPTEPIVLRKARS